ncbi:hypothetical protein HNY73_015477 [Argiope bruennichi]|uniref:Uncharacterized protein n=1 Tax=Argiope bruennichi TaxID=94029 RepID=A0A8T0EWX4_ARGBR|nr:hypothetical protein HNY73_015477 [Argiope bruennichi]
MYSQTPRLGIGPRFSRVDRLGSDTQLPKDIDMPKPGSNSQKDAAPIVSSRVTQAMDLSVLISFSNSADPHSANKQPDLTRDVQCSFTSKISGSIEHVASLVIDTQAPGTGENYRVPRSPGKPQTGDDLLSGGERGPFKFAGQCTCHSSALPHLSWETKLEMPSVCLREAMLYQSDRTERGCVAGVRIRSQSLDLTGTRFRLEHNFLLQADDLIEKFREVVFSGAALTSPNPRPVAEAPEGRILGPPPPPSSASSWSTTESKKHR